MQIRLQFHVVSDGHDQFDMQLKAFLNTMNRYGQKMTEVRRSFFWLVPRRNVHFLTEMHSPEQVPPC